MTIEELLTYAELKDMIVFKKVVNIDDPKVTRVRLKHNAQIATILYSPVDGHLYFIDGSLFLTTELGTSVKSSVSYEEILATILETP